LADIPEKKKRKKETENNKFIKEKKAIRINYNRSLQLRE
jgi:hypothetical protein